jgi:hypothetical protein
MSYKGDDLDLRPAPAGLTHEAASRPAAARAQPSREPIAVDQAVHDCCNAAYDVAHVHGAREVRLEHLLYALTRVAAARSVLAELGIRTEQLRRATAMTIADEPSAFADANGSPVASRPFEEVLRRAAAIAGKRQSAATLPDVLRVLLDSPVAILVTQAASDPQRLMRWREEPTRQTITTMAAPAAHPAPAVTEAVLDRLGALEASVKSLQANLAADRIALSEVLRELRTELTALRTSRPAGGGESVADAGALSGAVADRLTQTEASLQQLREETQQHWATARERQQALEASVRAQVEKADASLKGHHDDLTAVTEALVKLSTNQHALGENLDAWRAETSGDLGIISSRVEQLDHAALDMLSQLSADLNARRWGNGIDRAKLAENLKRLANGTSSALATGWRMVPPMRTRYRVRPSEAEMEPAEKPDPPAEPGKPS